MAAVGRIPDGGKELLRRKLRLGPDILRHRGEGGRDEPGGKRIVKADNGQRLGKRFPGLRKAADEPAGDQIF